MKTLFNKRNLFFGTLPSKSALSYCILYAFLFLPFYMLSQNKNPETKQDSIATSPTTEKVNLSISTIEINQQFIDYRRLEDKAYRESLEFGEALYQAIDSVIPFYNYPNTMELPYYLNNLSFQFAAIDWKAPHRIKYSYYLEGLEEDWSAPQSKAKVIYEQLPFGDYTFLLKAKTEFTTWMEPVKYHFSIRRAWWQSRLAQIIYLFSFGALSYLLMNYLMEKAKEQDELRQLRKWYNENLVISFPPKKTWAGKNEFLITVHQVLEEHLSDENFGIAELCEKLAIGRAQLYRKLKALTGKSTSHYIRFLRLTNAKKLLEETDLSVSEVAFKVGFSSHSYFSRVFKEEFGYRPSEIK